MGITYTPKSRKRDGRYLVSVKEYTQYHRDGYLIVRGLLSKEDIEQLYQLAERTKLGSIKPVKPTNAENAAESDKSDKVYADPLKEEFAQQTRVHMVSRLDAVAEWGMLHPRVLDVAEALIGPDVYALQSMMFLNPPGTWGARMASGLLLY